MRKPLREEIMLLKNTISILRKPAINPNADYCLQFTGNGYITINDLNAVFDSKNNFYISIEFKIDSFVGTEIRFLMNSCLDVLDNKIGIAVDSKSLYVQFNKGIDSLIELETSFTDTGHWHTLEVTHDRGELSARLDETALTTAETPSLTLPATLGFTLANNTAYSAGIVGKLDNILITDLRDDLAQYLLNKGSGNTAFDTVSSYNGTIVNGNWVINA